MRTGVEQTELLIKTLSADYTEKLFYFFLKKTGNIQDAEDLASDTVISIISQLRKGAIPVHFSAWVWKIARNRYCLWAEKKHAQTQSVSGAELDESVSDHTSVEDEYVLSEEKNLLRRELAFIASDYRDIVVSYYIDDRKIKDIAASLNLSEGTVKTRLFKARKLLNMAREFGVRSYKPEEVRFSASGNQPSGLPWKAVQRKIPKNILLQANNNPSTLEELSVELGIALPYMEEEVNLLTEATLLKKVEENKYITNFFIADRECQMAVYQAQRRSSKERSDMIDKIVTDSLDKIKALNILRNGMSDDDFKWLLVLCCSNQLLFTSMPYVAVEDSFTRPDGGNWGFMGFETNNGITENTAMSHNGCGNHASTMFWTFKIPDYNLWNRIGEPGYTQVLFLGDIIKNKRKKSSLTNSEEEIWKGIDGRFAHADSDGNIVPDIAVFENNNYNKMMEIFSAHPLFDTEKTNIISLYKEVVDILKSYSNPVLYENMHYYADMFMYDIRMMCVHDLVDSGKLIVPKNPEKSTIAYYIIIN